MPSPRRAAVVLAAVCLAGCGTEVVTGTATPGDESAAAGEPLSSVAEPEILEDLSDNGFIVASALDPDGEPLFLARSDVGDYDPLSLLRRRGGTWEETTLEDQTYLTAFARMGVSTDGTVVVIGFAEPGFAITRITPDETVTTVPLAGDIDNERFHLASAALAPDGDVLYAVFSEEDENGDDVTDVRHLMSVDPATGDVRAEATVTAESGDVEHVVPAISPDGDLLLAVTYDLDDSGSGETSTLTRYDADLAVVGEVPLVADEGIPADAWDVDVDAGGTATVTVAVGTDEDNTQTGIRVLSVEDGATSASELFSMDDEPVPDAIAVDTVGGWYYLVGLPGDDVQAAWVVTPVNLRTGETAEPLALCSGLFSTDLLLSDDGSEGLITMQCVSETAASLFTLT